MTGFDNSSWLFVALFFALIGLLAAINARVNREFKIDATWVVLAAMPAAIWMLLSGRITELAFPGGISIKTAANQEVSLKSDGQTVTPDKIEWGMKGGAENLDELQRRGALALDFVLGSPSYSDEAISEYLAKLSDLKYLIFTNNDGTYVGFCYAHAVRQQMLLHSLLLAQYIAQRNTYQIPSYRDISVSSGDTRAHVLQVMDQQQLSTVPVIDDAKHFAGVLDRDKLTSSIVADLVKQLAHDR
jgi:hypothetical protein